MAEPITLLINRADFTPYAQVAIHAREDAMLQPYILAAQNVDIKPVLGAALWYDLLTNPYGAYNELLLNGGSYIDDNGNTVTFQGIKAALACFAYARYILAKNAVDTPFGMVSKTSEYSEPVAPEQLVSIASEKRNEGGVYLRECVRYLDDAALEFPLWKADCARTIEPKFIHRLTPASKF